MVIKRRFVEDWCKCHPEAKFKIQDDDETTVDVEGSLEIRPTDLSHGELPFKIGRLSGDLILYCRDFKPSVLPSEIRGNIIFRNHLLGANTFTSKFGIGDDVIYLSKNKVANGIVKKLIIRSSYTQNWHIETSVTYYLGVSETRVDESAAFASYEDLSHHILNPGCILSAPATPNTFHTKYALGDEAWFVNDNAVMNRTIVGLEITVDDSELLNKYVSYIVKVGDETLNLKDTQIWDSRRALAEGF